MTTKFGQLAFISFLSAVPVIVFYDIGTRFAERGVDTGSAENNAAMYPRLIAALMAGLLAIQLAQTLRAERATTGEPLFQFAATIRKHARTIIVFGIFLGYLWAFRWFGFVYSTPVFLALVQITLGVVNPLKIGLYAIGLTAVVHFTFSKILHLALPAGDFFG